MRSYIDTLLNSKVWAYWFEIIAGFPEAYIIADKEVTVLNLIPCMQILC